MGKIYQALEKGNMNTTPSVTPPIKHAVRGTGEESTNIMLRKDLPALHDNQVENYYGIKVKIATRNPGKSIKSLLITAPSAGMGATTSAVNFAVSLAQDSQEKVLLIDANLRFPDIHEIFNMSYDQLLSFMVSHPDDSNSLFKQIRKNLYILATDKHQKGPLTLFESESFDNFIKAARNVFSYVILDGPPVNRYTDPLSIGAKVDGVLLVIDSGKTRRFAALNAKRELEESGANLLGVILNKRKYHIPDWLYNRL